MTVKIKDYTNYTVITTVNDIIYYPLNTNINELTSELSNAKIFESKEEAEAFRRDNYKNSWKLFPTSFIIEHTDDIITVNH